MKEMEKVILAFSKERFDLVLLSMPPLNNKRLLSTTESVDNEV